MSWIHSSIYIIACTLLLKQSVVNAESTDESWSLFEREISSYDSCHRKFLHITDFHFDPKYLEGADVDSYCHRTKKNKKDTNVGKYGALGTGCDSPRALVQATCKFLREKNYDFIVYTGDSVRHDRDVDLPVTENDVLNGHKFVMKCLGSAHNFKSTPYFPTIGNNDGFVHNTIGENDKIFSTLKSIWKPLNLNLTNEFQTGGYYVQDVFPNRLSIISLNSVYFYEKNIAVSDCGNSSSAAAIQMKWLERNLKHYKKKNHQVYIMSHIPPIDSGSATYKPECYSQYLNLLGNYGSIISGHFTGHTDNDTLTAVIPTKEKKFTYMAVDDLNAHDMRATLAQTRVGLFNAPSVIPVNNPALRFYCYEAKGKKYPFGTIRDWDQYYVEIKRANEQRNLKYKLEYKASQFYKVNHFDGAGIGKAIHFVANNEQAYNQYKKYAVVSSQKKITSISI